MEQLQQMGWTTLHGAQLAPALFAVNGEREYLREVVREITHPVTAT